MSRDRQPRRLPDAATPRPERRLRKTWPMAGSAAGRDKRQLDALLALLVVLGAPAAVSIWGAAPPGNIIFGVLFGVPFLFVLVVGVASLGRRTRTRSAGRRLPEVAGPAPMPADDWKTSWVRFHHLRDEYARFECDPMAILRLPALADVSVASTARFVDAFAEAQALETDRFPGAEHAPRFVAAVESAERAWRAARDAAERIRLSGLTPAERATVERVIKVLTTARDSDSEPERLAAYARARSELARLDRAGVIHVPLPAQALLDEAARGQLPA